MMTEDEFDAVLAHYGVKGMKWGVIRDQQRVISEAERLQNGTPKLTKGQVNRAALKSYMDKQSLESGDFHRRALLGQAYLDGRQHSFKKNDKLAQADDYDSIMRDVVKPINPDFGKPGTKMNCRRCTFAYEMRRRGEDVMPTLTTNASGQHFIGVQNAVTPGQDKATRGKAFYKEVKSEFKKNPALNPWGENAIDESGFNYKEYRQKIKDEAKRNGTKTSWFKLNTQAGNAMQEHRNAKIFSELEKQGNGARGELGLGWMLGGGHSVAYEVVKGKAVVFDTQTGKSYQTPKELQDLTAMAGQVAYTRLDNKTLNDDYLKRWVQDA